MRSTARLIAATIAVVIAMQPLSAQGKGKGSSKDEGNKSGQRRETRSDARIERRQEREFAGDVDLPGRGRGRAVGRGRFVRDVVVDDLRPSVRRFLVEDRPLSRAAVGAVARAHLRGVDEGELVIRPLDDHVRILNRDGAVLVALDDERIRNLGRWDVIPVDDDVADGSPAFCRSGAGHPVFGRHWCIDKRFGLGSDNDFRWGRTERITDLLFLQPVTGESLTRDALLAVLGPVAFDRLALHAITMGLSDPLRGRWMVSPEPGASNVLLVSSGSVPVAEVVDIDRDNRADMLVVALRNW
ncbi:MAG: hypothetical protein ACREOK_04470 [Gemmatimonadaceae bacterium]